MTTCSNFSIYKNEDILGSYLAGLWEGDGHVIMSRNNTRPSFHITFNIKYLPLAEKLLAFMVKKCCPLRVGSIQHRVKENACVLHVRSIEGLLLIANLINGKLRTPKAYQIDNIIDWLNSNHNAEIKKLPISNCSLCANAWFTGFIDADGYFYVKHSAETKTTYKQTLCSFSIEQRTMYPKTNQSYEHIFNLIAKFLWVKLRIRKHKNTTNNYYLIVMTSAKSKKKLRAYLDKYPLLSAKSFNYKDWCKADDLMNDKRHLTPEGYAIIEGLRQNMNRKRAYFGWDHLEEF